MGSGRQPTSMYKTRICVVVSKCLPPNERVQEVQCLHVGSSIGYTMLKMALGLSEFVRLHSCQFLDL